jgi:hypothetical protein
LEQGPGTCDFGGQLPGVLEAQRKQILSTSVPYGVIYPFHRHGHSVPGADGNGLSSVDRRRDHYAESGSFAIRQYFVLVLRYSDKMHRKILNILERSNNMTITPTNRIVHGSYSQLAQYVFY